MRKSSYLFAALSLALLALFGLQACQSGKPERITPDPAFEAYLSAYTQGEISKKSKIWLRFAEEISPNKDESLLQGLWQIEPKVPGQLSWVDSRTLVFSPEGDLPSDQIFKVSVAMRRLIPDLPQGLEQFVFQFKTKKQLFNVSPLAGQAYQRGDEDYWSVQGEVRLHDAEDQATLAEQFKLKHGGKAMNLRWTKLDDFHYRFVSDSLRRGDGDSPLEGDWLGKTLGGDFTIPGKGDFRYRRSFIYNQPEQYLVLEFSDLLKPDQDLNGLITLGGKAVKFSIEGNRIKIYPNIRLLGPIQLFISGDILGLKGKPLGGPTTETLTFSDEKPALRWVGKGNIIPRSKTMPVIFQSINLRAVDVRVIKIKESNVQQFLQVNHLPDNEELKRVGQLVMTKRIELDQTPGLNLSEWTYHSLDLAELLTPEPGAIYEVALGFRRSYSLYACSKTSGEEEEEKDMLALPGHWDSPTYEYSYWDYYGEDFEYEDLENPCKTYYYSSSKSIRRNVLGSDLGILAKQGDNGNLFVVNNLHDTEPMKGVTLEFYDYHQDLITSVETDKEGFARPELKKKPFLVIAKQGKQRGYLRLDDGSALSMSRFDVQGYNYAKGLKGFIYGERGVWRPGDELFLNFILEDRDGSLPAKHPVLFELRDPKGKLVERKTSTEGVKGVYNFTCSTREDAPTGNYSAVVRVGGATFSKTLKIETIKPNRLKIALDFGKAIQGKKPEGSLKANWLHGAVAPNLKANIEMSLRNGQASFKDYAGFSFFDPAANYQSESQVVYEGSLDGQGQAKIKLDFKDLEGPFAGPMKAVFDTKVFEPGGDFSIDQAMVDYHPYQRYIGLRLPQGDERRDMLLTDKKHRVEVASVDTEGKAVSVGDLEVKVYKLEWRWWFDRNKNEVSGYRGNINAELKQEAKLSTSNGKGNWDFEIKYPEWGRYLIRVCDGQGHCAGQVVYVDWPGWAGRSQERDPEGATALNFSADKEKYQVGEDITLNIPTGFAGRALITIESGSRILEAKWVQAEKGQLRHSFKATASMAPNVYAYVTLLQPHAQTRNDLPIRMYGALNLNVEDPNTRLEPVIATASEYQPLRPFTVEVSEKRGGPMTYTLAVVDEGLLDLTRFKTPSPWDNFYQRIGLGVKTWDMYNEVLGAFGGQVKSLLSIGGDEMLNPADREKQNRFKPVVRYLGPFHLEAGKKAKHELQMPNYVGSVRVMVVAANTEKAAYGNAEQAVPVRQGLMVLGTAPRVLGPGETMRLPVSIFAMKDNMKSVEVSIQTNELLQIQGESKRQVSFSKPGEQMAYFELKTPERLGQAYFKIQVRSGNETAFYETDLEIRQANPLEYQVVAQTLNANQPWSHEHKPQGIVGSNKLRLEVSSVPPMNLGPRLNYLLRYPYGCLEQVTSAAFPQLYVGKLTELTEAQQSKVDSNVRAAIGRLAGYQNLNGGMAYWPGQGDNHDWATNYVGHFLLEALKMGYKVPEEVWNKWLNYQAQTAQQWTESGQTDEAHRLEQSYRLLLLAQAGKAEIGAMNRLRTNSKLPQAGVWQLAAAYQLAGQENVARELSSKASLQIIQASLTARQRHFGSTLRDQALVLQCLSILGQKDKAGEVLQSISQRLSSPDWLNTQEVAQSLVAVGQFLQLERKGQSWSFEYRLGQDNWQKVSTDKPFFQRDIPGEAPVKIEVRHSGSAPLFARLQSESLPISGQETASSQGLEMAVQYLSLDGKKLEPQSLKQGQEFMAEVKVSNKSGQNQRELALTHIVPSGWEIINTRLLGIAIGGDKASYEDFRDDRCNLFFDLDKGQSKTFRLRLNAAYLGSFYLPAIEVHAMYDKAVQARQKGRRVEVVAQK